MVVADIVCVVTSAVEQDSHSLKPNHDYMPKRYTLFVHLHDPLNLGNPIIGNPQNHQKNAPTIPKWPKCYMVGL